MKNESFRFLSSAEFNQLAQAEKMDYLARAVAALSERDAAWQQLFYPDSRQIAQTAH